MLKALDQADFSTLQSEVCIVGAGPAGITLAMELAEKGVDVVLLEGGGMAPPEPEGLDLYRGEISGRQYPLRASRLRYLVVPLGTGEAGVGPWMRWILPRSQTLSSAGGRLSARSSPLVRRCPSMVTN